jgi:hypothetical protein
MLPRFTNEWPGGSHGFALWFTGAPQTVQLAVTQFWHPALDRSRVANAGSRGFRWRDHDRIPKAVSLFAVHALTHLVQDDDGDPFVYTGTAKLTLYNAFKRGANRSQSMMAIFDSARAAIPSTVKVGDSMRHAFIQVEGSEAYATVRLHPKFQARPSPEEPYSIYVFWQSSPINRPDWNLPRITSPGDLNRVAQLLSDLLASADSRCPATSPKESRRASERGAPQADKVSQPPGANGSGDAQARSAPSISTQPDRLHSHALAERVVKRSFMECVFVSMFGESAERFQTVFVRDFVTDFVQSQMPESASVVSILNLCESLGAIEDSYSRTLDSIPRHWTRFRPETKVEIHNFLANSILSRDAITVPPLTDEDRKDLEIRWTEADCDYGLRRQEALTKCKTLGFSADDVMVDLAKLDEVMDVLASLLERKVEIDKSYVARASARMSASSRSRIENRARHEYETLTALLRETIRCQWGEQWALQIRIHQGLRVLPSAPSVTDLIDRYLAPLTRRWRQIEKSLT